MKKNLNYFNIVFKNNRVRDWAERAAEDLNISLSEIHPLPTQENIINKNQRIKISRLGDRENNYSEHMNNRLNEQVTYCELEIFNSIW